MTYRVWRGRLSYIAAIVTLLALWQVAAWMLPSYLLPGIPETLARLTKVVRQAEFLAGLRQSLFRFGIAYPLACFLGAALGLLAGLFRGFAVYLRGLISILQAVPPITWAPFLMILLGFGTVPIIIMITIASFFPMALSVMNATEGVSRTHLELARVMGASRWQLLAKVYLPETVPALITGAQVAFGNAWRSLISGEMVLSAGAGLGFSIKYAGDLGDMKGVLIGILFIGGIAVLVDHLVLEQIKRRLLHWRSTDGGEAA